MFKSLKCLMAAVVLAWSVGTGTAHAHALAVSDILLSNLLFRNAATGTILDRSDFGAVLFTNSANTSATIGGTSDTHSGFGSPLDLYSCVGVGCPVNNTFPFLTPPPVSTFATGDQLEGGAPITGLGLLTGATVDAAAYASVISSADPVAASNNSLSSTFQFALAANTAVQINFNAQAYLDAFTAASEIFPTFAIAGYSTCFTITAVGVVGAVANWCPDGINNNDLGMTATTEPFSLNQVANRNSPFNGNTTTGVQSGFFSGTTVTLIGGVPYQLAAVETSTASGLEVVPEPETLALLGVGMLGLAFSRRKFGIKR
jgi:PEP-CTERM motif